MINYEGGVIAASDFGNLLEVLVIPSLSIEIHACLSGMPVRLIANMTSLTIIVEAPSVESAILG